MSTVNRTPFNELSPDVAYDPKFGDTFRLIIELIDQLRIRTGGDADVVGDSQTQIEAEDSRRIVELRQLTRRVNDLQSQLATLASVNVAQREIIQRLTTLEDSTPAFPQLHAALYSLQRRVNELENQVN